LTPSAPLEKVPPNKEEKECICYLACEVRLHGIAARDRRQAAWVGFFMKFGFTSREHCGLELSSLSLDDAVNNDLKNNH
jgi:hypothetical protein